MSRANRIAALAALVVLVGAIAFLSSRPPPVDAGSATCEVYRAFVTNVSEEPHQRFRPFLRSIPHADALSDTAEMTLSRETGEHEAHTVQATGEVFEFPVTEEFTVNISGYSTQRAEWLPTCFDSSPRPSFTVMPAIIEFGLAIPVVGDITIWEISRVSFSPDGQSALFYAEHFCGELCAGGGYFLYELRDGAWHEAGYRMSWVS